MLSIRPARILAGSVSALLLAATAHAETWDGGGGDNLFGTGANWIGDVSPLPGQTTDLTFAGSIQLAPNNNYTAFDDFHSLTFDATAGAYMLSGSAIDIFGKIENYSTATQTVSFDLAVNAGQAGTGEFNPVNGDLVINSANVFTNGNTLHVYGVNNKTVTFGANTVISQAGGFTVEQASNVVFLGANTYSGATNVSAGSLTVGDGGTTGQLGTGAVNVVSGATLAFNRSNAFSPANTFTIAGALVKDGAGAMTIAGAQTGITGTVTINGGRITMGANNSLGTASITLNGGTIERNAAGVTVANNIAIGANGGTILGRQVVDNYTTFSGIISGTGPLSVQGLVVLNNAANTYVGNISVASSPSSYLRLDGSQRIGAASTVTLGGTAASLRLDGIGVEQTLAALNGTDGRVFSVGSGAGATYKIESGTYAGQIDTGGGPLTLIKQGAGTLTLNRAVSNSSALTAVVVNSGTLALAHTTDSFDRGYFTGTTPITVNAGGTLDVTRLWTIKSTNVVTINGGTMTFSSPFVQTISDTNYVNFLTLQNGAVVNGPAGFRVGNSTPKTLTSTGNTTNTIATPINFIRSVAGFNYTMDVADGAAAVDLLVSEIIRDDTGFTQAMTLQKTGAGTLALTAANTYADPTTIAAGTLQIGTGGTTGTPGSGAITNNATLAFNRSDALSVANAISGTGALIHAGTGTTTLTGAVSYAGTTSVNAGTLITTPAQTGATSITVADGASFGVKLVTAGTTFSANSVTTGSVTGASLFFDIGAFGNPTAAPMSVGTLTPTAPTTLRVQGSNLAAGTFTLLDYGTLGGMGIAGFTLSLPFRVGGTLSNNPGNTSLDVNISGAETAVWQGNVAGGDWDIDPNGGNTAGTFNWKTSMLGTSTRYAQGAINTDTVTFDDSATGTTSVNLTTTLAPINLAVNNTTLPYTFGGTGKISGTTGLTKQGNGVLTLANSGANDFTGAVNIQAGTLAISTINDANAAGPLGQSATAVTLGAAGSTGTIQFSGLTASSNKPLILATGGAGTLQVDNASTILTLGGGVSGNGTLGKTGAGTLILSGTNSYSGNTVIRSGTLEGRTNSAFGTGTITLGDSGTGASDVALYLGNRADISNAITVSADGSGLVTLGGSNAGTGANATSYLGQVTLNRPTMFSGEITSDRLTFDGRITGNVGTLIVRGGGRTTFSNTANDFIGDVIITGSGTILQTSVATAAEVIPNGSSVIVDTGAVLQLASNANAETINALSGAGVVRTFSGGTYGSGLVVGSAGGSGNFSGSLQNGAAGNPLSLTKVGAGIQELSGTNTYTGTTTITEGTLAITGSGSISNSALINVQMSGTLDVSGVNAGYVLTFGQTLKGTGAVHGATLVDGMLAPGDSIGTLTFNNVLNFSSVAQLALELGGSAPGQSDSITGVTNLTLDGTVAVSLFGGFIPEAGNTFDLLNWTGTLDSTGFNLATDLVLPSLTGDLTWNTSNFLVDGTLAVVPEPSVAISLIGGAGFLLARRRRRP